MSSLRRRIGRQLSGPPSTSRDGSPDAGEEIRLVPVSKLKNLTTKTKSKRKAWSIFSLGGLVGLLVALFFAQHNEVVNLEKLIEVNLETIMEAMPAGMKRELKDITVRPIQFTSPFACADSLTRNQNEKPSIMIPFLWASIYSPREYPLIILS